MFPEMTPERKAAALALYERANTTLEALREELSALPKEIDHDGRQDCPVFLVAIVGQNVEPSDRSKAIHTYARRDDMTAAAMNIMDQLR